MNAIRAKHQSLQLTAGTCCAVCHPQLISLVLDTVTTSPGMGHAGSMLSHLHS
jgi:hypothetical protein